MPDNQTDSEQIDCAAKQTIEAIPEKIGSGEQGEAQMMSAILQEQMSAILQEQMPAILQKQMSALRKELRLDIRRLGDRISMVENHQISRVVLGAGSGPEPVRMVSTGSGLIDPEWRWEREHPFR